MTKTFYATGQFGSWTVQDVDIQDISNQPPEDPSDPDNYNVWVDLNACPNQGWIKQTIDTISGMDYTVYFNLGVNPHGDIGTSRTMNVTIINDDSETIAQQSFEVSSVGATNSYSNMNWDRKSITFEATSEQTTIKFNSTTESCYGPVLDCVEVCEYITGDLYVWGRGDGGPWSGLGDGTTNDSLVPIQIENSSIWKSVSVGFGHYLGIKIDNTLWAWGNNIDGRLGDGTTIDRLVPVQIGTSTWK